MVVIPANSRFSGTVGQTLPKGQAPPPRQCPRRVGIAYTWVLKGVFQSLRRFPPFFKREDCLNPYGTTLTPALSQGEGDNSTNAQSIIRHAQKRKTPKKLNFCNIFHKNPFSTATKVAKIKFTIFKAYTCMKIIKFSQTNI